MHISNVYIYIIYIYNRGRSQILCNIGPLKNFSILTRKAPVLESLFNKKETPKQLFSSEYCEIFENSLFYRTPPVTAFSNVAYLIVSPNC